MNSGNIENSLNSYLSELEFTPKHRLVVLQKAKKTKQRQDIYRGTAVFGTLAAALVVAMLAKSPYHDCSSQVASMLEDETTPTYTASSTMLLAQLTDINEAQALEMARTALALRTHKNRADVDSLLFKSTENADMWIITFYAADDLTFKNWLYEAQVDKVSEETEITRNDAVLAQDDEEAVETTPVTDENALALRAYENHMQRTKGNMLFWSLKEKAHRSDLAAAAGLAGPTRDALPKDGDLSMETAIKLAREQLKASGKANGLDVDTLIPFVSFLADNKNNAVWYIQFAQNKSAERTIGVEVKARRAFASKDAKAEEAPYYYNPQGGVLYHSDPYCSSVSSVYLPLSAIDSDTAFQKLKPCPNCTQR